jgi:hypothetical protein
LTEEESKELKKLYTLIVKKLHPDINSDTTEEQHAQFVDAVNAYKNANLSELRIIYLLLEKTSVTETVNSMDKLEKRKELLINEKEYLLNEIQNIKETFPYLLDEMKIGAKLRFVREPDNKYDKLAILVKDQDNNKLGYVPREKNPILARLMDAGKLIYGTVKEINNDDSYINIEMEIFMDD